MRHGQPRHHPSYTTLHVYINPPVPSMHHHESLHQETAERHFATTFPEHLELTECSCTSERATGMRWPKVQSNPLHL